MQYLAFIWIKFHLPFLGQLFKVPEMEITFPLSTIPPVLVPSTDINHPNIKNSGPSTNPCGTLLITGLQSDNQPSNTILWLMPSSWFCIQLASSPWIPGELTSISKEHGSNYQARTAMGTANSQWCWLHWNSSLCCYPVNANKLLKNISDTGNKLEAQETAYAGPKINTFLEHLCESNSICRGWEETFSLT